MLRVPESTFESDDMESGFAPASQPTEHVLALGGRDDPFARYGAILAALKRDAPANGDRRPDDAPEREERHLKQLFAEANVRNALTDLHERGEAFAEELGRLSGADVVDIVAKAETFLRDQEQDLAKGLADDRQKRMYARCHAAYAASFLDRARFLREIKIRRYRSAVAERQNRSFLALALRPENLFNDALQTRLRDMYLLNLDDLHSELDEKERRARLDEAHRDFCVDVLDSRLRFDPGRMDTLLKSPAVRRVMGDRLVAQYREKAGNAVRADKLRAVARSWFAADIEPGEAERRAARELSDPDERRTALARYRDFRLAANRELARGHAAAVEPLWREVLDGTDSGTAIVDALSRSDPELAGFLEKEARDKAERCGMPPRPDYVRVLDVARNFSPRDEAEAMRRRDGFLRKLGDFGGFDCEIFHLYFNMVQGGMSEDAGKRLEALETGRLVVLEALGEIDAACLNDFLHLLDGELRRAGVSANNGEPPDRVETIKRTRELFAAWDKLRRARVRVDGTADGKDGDGSGAEPERVPSPEENDDWRRETGGVRCDG